MKTLSLGGLLDQLRECVRKDGAAKIVRFDFGSAVPTTFGAWRGDYSQIALGYRLSGYDSNTEVQHTAYLNETIRVTEAALNTPHPGWKGGVFKATRHQCPVYVSNPGNSGATVIVGVHDSEHSVTLLTSLQGLQ